MKLDFRSHTVRQKRTLLSWAGCLLLGAIVLLTPFPSSDTTPRERVFEVQASRFAYTPSVLRVNPGDQVTIELKAKDVVHGLSVDGYDLEMSADPGQTARLSFTADRKGSFRLSCSITCGGMHPFMAGRLQVGTNDLLWRGIGLAGLTALFAIWRGGAGHD